MRRAKRECWRSRTIYEDLYGLCENVFQGRNECQNRKKMLLTTIAAEQTVSFCCDLIFNKFPLAESPSMSEKWKFLYFCLKKFLIYPLLNSNCRKSIRMYYSKRSFHNKKRSWEIPWHKYTFHLFDCLHITLSICVRPKPSQHRKYLL